MEILEVVDGYVSYPSVSKHKEILNIDELKENIKFYLENDVYWEYVNEPIYSLNSMMFCVLEHVLRGINQTVPEIQTQYFKLIHHKCVMIARSMLPVDLDFFYDYAELDDGESIVIRKYITEAPRRCPNTKFFLDFEDYSKGVQLIKVI